MFVPRLKLHPKIIRIIGPKRPFLPQDMLSWAHLGLAGLFDTLLVGWLVVVMRGLYVATHRFTLYIYATTRVYREGNHPPPPPTGTGTALNSGFGIWEVL